MYKLVVVEDELDVRKRLISLVEKVQSKFELVAEYENGIDAYDGITQDNPDLIVTDIRIPYIDGLELAKRVREVLPLVKIIVVTGYNEFDYAKEAANLGVVGFVSKPITVGDVQGLLQKAADALDEEYGTAASLNRLEEFYQNSLPILREYDLYRLASLQEIPPAFARKLAYNHIDLDFEYFAMCVFDSDGPLEADPERQDLSFSSVRKLVGEEFVGLSAIELFNWHETLCLILKSHVPIPMSEVEAKLERVVLRVGRFSGVPLSVGASGVYHNNKNFAAMREEAMRALAYRSAVGGGRVFLYGNSAALPGAKTVVDDTDIKELTYLLRYKSATECEKAIGRIRRIVEAEGARSSYLYVLTGMLNALLRACDDLDALYARAGGQSNLYRRLFESKTAAEAFGWLSELAGSIRELNEGIIVDNVEFNFQRVLAYIEAHFCDADISFEAVAENVNFSVSYISALLKKKMNTSFVKYLTSLRMEKAKVLLANPALKIIDVAEQLGYSDPYYFSHCFKKYTGSTPKEYRSHA